MKALKAVPILLLMVLFAFSCDDADQFAKYEGVNFLEGLNFDNPSWVRKYKPEDPQPLFTDYMLWEEVTTETSPAANMPVYRLEIQNLFPDGMFEDPASTGLWDTTGVSTTFTINSGQLQYVFQLDDIALYRLNDAVNGLYHLRTGGEVLTNIDKISYILHYDFIDDGLGGGQNIWMDLSNSTGSVLTDKYELTGEKSVAGTPVLHQFIISEPEDYTDLSIGMVELADKGPQSGSIDNLRIIRNDIDYKIAISLPYHSASRWNTDLISGTYTFTVSVKNDGRAGSANHFPGEYVTLEIKSLALSGQASAKIYYQPGGWADWTDISVSGFFQIDKTAVTSMDVLELSIQPTITRSEDGVIEGLEGRDTGALLFANPRLTYSALSSSL